MKTTLTSEEWITLCSRLGNSFAFQYIYLIHRVGEIGNTEIYEAFQDAESEHSHLISNIGQLLIKSYEAGILDKNAHSHKHARKYWISKKYKVAVAEIMNAVEDPFLEKVVSVHKAKALQAVS